ncbi:MAG TPA: hypothetical protein VEI24_04585, partial [Nitrospiria bacterium]|nr:hypothetical protein [Nitrospiria bacterium]
MRSRNTLAINVLALPSTPLNPLIPPSRSPRLTSSRYTGRETDGFSPGELPAAFFSSDSLKNLA